MFSIFFLLEGNFDIDAGDGGGGGPFRTPKSYKNPKNPPHENCSHFWDISPKMSKNIFRICSYIQKKKTNPIFALEITIHCTKHTNNPKISKQKNTKLENIFETPFLFYYISNFHNSDFVYFVYFIFLISCVYFIQLGNLPAPFIYLF